MSEPEPIKPMDDAEFRVAMDGLIDFLTCPACADGDEELILHHIRHGHTEEREF